ncbi:MAG: DinB family protein [Chthoniobacterales bacterium]|nr:DinB family protein [Chthoniobacterales bacterium]
MFVNEADDPRADGGWDNDERSILLGFISDRRLTLELKCSGLDADQMAQQSVPPSDMSLLGLVRHLTSVENHWFQTVIAGRTGDRLYTDPNGADLAFVVEPDAGMVEEAWATWHREVARSDDVVASVSDLGQVGAGTAVPVREVLVHLIREYAQHLGHADLLRERIDGRVGQ